jgi:hypothetical protein
MLGRLRKHFPLLFPSCVLDSHLSDIAITFFSGIHDHSLDVISTRVSLSHYAKVRDTPSPNLVAKLWLTTRLEYAQEDSLSSTF